MSAITLGIFNRLNGDSTLTDLLGSFDGRKAIFTYSPAPKDTGIPYIVTSGEITDAPNDNKTTTGRVITRDIRCFAKANKDPRTLETIAERIRTLFNQAEASITITGFKVTVAEAFGPREIPTDENELYGRLVTIQLTLAGT